jgi:hypothetical protein
MDLSIAKIHRLGYKIVGNLAFLLNLSDYAYEIIKASCLVLLLDD